MNTALVHLASDSTFLVTAGPVPMRELYHADRSGQITRRIGRDGEGPGEYRRPLYVGETEDAFVVIDPTLQRATALSKSDLALLRTTRLPVRPGNISPVVHADGSMIVYGSLLTRAGAGLPFHFLAPDGSVKGSFGPSCADNRPLDVQAMAASGDSAVGVAYEEEYRLELWSLSGDLIGSWQRSPTWFRVLDSGVEGIGEKFHRVERVHEDEQGQLWVMIIEMTRAGNRRIDTTPSSFATIIEVLNPYRGELVVAGRWEATREAAAAGRGFFNSVCTVARRDSRWRSGPLDSIPERGPHSDRR